MPAGLEQWYEAWQVRRAIDALPPDEREVVRLQHLEGLTHTEIAEQLGIPPGTVKSRSHRAHQRLAVALERLAGGARSVNRTASCTVVLGVGPSHRVPGTAGTHDARQEQP